MKSIIGESNKLPPGSTNTLKYGAYELRKLYQKYLTKGLIIAIILHSLFISGYLFVVYLEKIKADSEKDNIQRVLFLEDAEIHNLNDEIAPELPKALKDPSALIPEPVAKANVTEEVKLKSQKELDDVKLPVSSIGTDDASKVNPNAEFSGKVEEKKIEEKIERKEETNKNVFEPFEVEMAPTAVNLDLVKRLLRYPEIARQSGIEGKVVARILVGTGGSVLKLGSISGPEIFRNEVADKVMNLQFNPAIQGGQTVKCWVSVPFNFTLNTNHKKKFEDEE